MVCSVTNNICTGYSGACELDEDRLPEADDEFTDADASIARSVGFSPTIAFLCPTEAEGAHSGHSYPSVHRDSQTGVLTTPNV